MAVELATAYISLVPTTKGIQGKLAQEMGGAGTAASRSFGSKFSSGVKRVVGTAAKAALVTAGVTAGAALLGGFKSAIDQQKSQKTLAGLYDSAATAKKVMEDLRKVSSKSSIDYSSYTKTAETLAYMGVKGKDVAPILSNMGKMITGAGGSSDDLERAGDAMLKMVNSGKVYAADLNQLSQTGIPVISGLATKMFGDASAASIAKMREAVTKGKVSVQDVQDVIKNATGKNAKAQIRAAEQVEKTFSATWKRTKDNVVVAIGGMLKPLITKLTPVLAHVGKVITKGIGGIPKAFSRAKGIVSEFRLGLDKLAAVDLSRMLTGGDKLQGVFEALIPAGRDIASSLKDLWESAKSTAPAFKKMIVALMPLAKDLIHGAIVAIVVAFRALAAIGGRVAAALKKVGDFAEKHPKAFRRVAAAVLATVVAYKALSLAFKAKDAATAAGGLVKLAQKTRLGAAATRVWTTATRTAAGVQTLATRAALGTRIQLAALKVQTIATALAQKVAAVAAKGFVLAQRLVNAAMRANPIGLVVTALLALAAGLVYAYKHSKTFRKIVDAAFSAVKKVAKSVVDWFTKKFVPFFTKKIPAAFRTVVGWAKKHWPLLLGILTGPIGLFIVAFVKYRKRILAGFRAAWSWVKGTFKKAWNGVKDILANPLSRARDLIKSTWNKVTDKFGAAKNWVKGTFKKAWDGVKAILTNPVQSAKNVFHKLLGSGGTVRSIFSNAVDAISRIWAKVANLMRKPLNWVITTVINGGILKAAAKVAGWVGAKSLKKKFNAGVPTIPAFATGGTIGGRRKPYGDKVLTHLAPGEEVISNRRGQADRFRPLLKRINGMAGGGTVGYSKRVWPVPGHDTGTYPGHDGVDINRGSGSDDYGDLIRAAAAGKISYVGFGRGYGRGIFERGPYGELVYGHTSHASVRAGQVVSAGQPIGRVGSTGHSSAPHLHFGFPGGTTAQALAFLRGAINPAGGLAAAGGSFNAAGPSQPGWVSSLLGGPKNWLMDKVAGPLKDGASKFAGNDMFKLAAGIPKMLVGQVGSWLKDKVSGFVGKPDFTGYSGVKQWTPKVINVLRELGASGTLLPDVMRRMAQESGGNPGIVNTTDSNWAAGHPSVGLMQVIEGTFKAYAGKYKNTGPFKYGVSTDPTANIYAGLNYAKHRYGSIATAMNKSGGYDSGGVAVGPGYMPKRTPRPERVLSPAQTESFDRLVDLLEKSGPGTGGGAVNISMPANSSPGDVADEVLFALRRTDRGGVYAGGR